MFIDINKHPLKITPSPEIWLWNSDAPLCLYDDGRGWSFSRVDQTQRTKSVMTLKVLVPKEDISQETHTSYKIWKLYYHPFKSYDQV